MGNNSTSKSALCPYLGLYDDPDTSLGYPSESNCCYRSTEAEIVGIDHQQAFCLSMAHQQCPVFLRQQALPPVKKPLLRSGGSRFRWLGIALIVLIVIAIIVIVLIQNLGAASQQTPEPATTNPSALAINPNSSPTTIKVTLSPTPAPSKTRQPTATVSPTPTATATLQPSPTPKATATNPNSVRLVLHQVVEGDSLSLIAAQFHTTPEAIQAINYNFQLPLQQKYWIVIPANTSDVRSLPQFEIVVNSKADITLREFANGLKLSLDLLLQYNELQPDDKLKADQRIIVPKTLVRN